jgi:hypothetical protein
MIPSFGGKTRREFRYSFQPLKRPTLSEVAQLYDAPDGSTQDVTDYSQAEDLSGQVWVDVTFGRFAGTYALEFRPTGVLLLGSGTSIQVGG